MRMGRGIAHCTGGSSGSRVLHAAFVATGRAGTIRTAFALEHRLAGDRADALEARAPLAG